MRIPKTLPAVATSALAFLVFSAIPAQSKDANYPQHYDPYVRGPANENNLIKEVRHNLLMLPYYGVFDDLGFNVKGSTVTLTGEVTRPTLKDDAGRVVKGISGVANVVNNIEVLPLSPSDDAIRIAAYRAIYGDPTLAPRYAYSATPSIHIIVKNGHLRLEGFVGNQMDKNTIGIRANGVHGVFSVENDLQIDNS